MRNNMLYVIKKKKCGCIINLGIKKINKKKNQKKYLMVASNLDDVFHIVFIATDRCTTKNQKVGFCDPMHAKTSKKSVFRQYLL